ncbi:hypothetical protein GCM10007881_63980 [Mesorhizobium huakuii]|uniref:HK97 family phage prohead protease n=1 Tax=Mesorhizobium huakuii TaxID=28104 RepID=UPI00235BF634|nr:HK97 family phage prohead protease [Mesorhizobium huakuii]GLQ82875.1 hypothetical protein GCM10007881_63980 [Mesorhizobium huakuii]
MITKDFMGSGLQTLADKRQVQVICSSGGIDRAGEVVDQAGIDVSAFMANPIILWNHNPNVPIARAIDIGVMGGKLRATCQFPAVGVSAKADEILGLVQSGVINCVSIGFNPVEKVAMPGASPKNGPFRYLKSQLWEFSFVSVPANGDALITGRSAPLADIAADRAARMRAVEVMRLAAEPIDQAQEARHRQIEVLALVHGPDLEARADRMRAVRALVK